MAGPRGLARHARRERGFILLVVLWVLVLLAAIALHLSSIGRTEARIAFNLVANAKAESLADGGIARAVFGLLDPNPDQRWAADGIARQIRLQGGTATITIRDENTKINPNLAPEGLMFALLQEAGVDPDRARHLAAAIADWISPGPTARPFGAKAAEYNSAGLAYGPPGAPLESVDELARVLGMSPEILAALRPSLSTFSTAAVPDPATAAALVQRAVERFHGGTVAAGTSLAGIRGGIPGVVGVSVVARTDTGAVFVRDAVLRVEPQAPKGYVLLAWRQGALPEQ